MTRYHARWLLPITSPPVRDGTVVERDGRIVYVGPRNTAPAEGDDVELGDALLFPGFVNAHCHLELTAMRGFLDGLAFHDWIRRLTRARQVVLTHEMLLDAARLGLEEGLLRGITTFADTSESGTGFDAMLERGVRGICYREVFGPDPASCNDAMVALRGKVDAMRARETPLVRVGVSPHSPYTVSDALFRATADFARAANVPMAVHIAESALESALVERGEGSFADALRARGIGVAPRGRSPVALLLATGVLQARPLLIHCVRTNEADHRLIAEHDCAVAHCPASNARLGHGIAPLAELRAAGIRVGLGSDSVASNEKMDLLDEARLASLFASARARSPDALSASAALELATLGGACALGMQTEIGSLEVGKSADLTAIAAPAERLPVHDPVVAALFALAGTAASLVVVAGRVLVRQGQLVHADRALAQRVQASANLLQDWLATDQGRACASPAARLTP